MLNFVSSTPLDLHLPEMASKGATEHAVAAKRQNDVQRYIHALIDRLAELKAMADLARKFRVFSDQQCAEFKVLFLKFRDLCDEFQTLSGLTAILMARINKRKPYDAEAAAIMKGHYESLQVGMLEVMTGTLMHLLQLWRDRLADGNKLPLGTHEILQETVRVIFTARLELLRPRYIEALDEAALTSADEAGRLVKMLLKRSPKYAEFSTPGDDPIDRELMRLINGG